MSQTSEAGPFGPLAFGGTGVVPAVRAASTLIQGTTFCLADEVGDIAVGQPHGLFFLDTRVLSRFQVRANGRPLERLGVDPATPFMTTFVTRTHPAAGLADAHLVVTRHRAIGRGMRERIIATNHGMEPATLVLELRCDVDFADLFEVKDGRLTDRARDFVSTPRTMCFGRGDADDQVEIAFDRPAVVDEVRFVTVEAERRLEESSSEVVPIPSPPHGLAVWTVELAAGASWELCVEVTLTRRGTRFEPRFRCGVPDADVLPVRQRERWHADTPDVDTDDADLSLAVRTSIADLESLRIYDPSHPEWAVLAAGAPWFMTVFGRDSLLTAWMGLMADADLARGVLRTLARLQGSRVDDATEEQPGRILHEIRAIDTDELAIDRARVYFGSVDATPLFVMLLGELARWHPDDALITDLLPHADRALEWIDTWGDPDGDGFVAYERRSPMGLVNQGWKDSWDGVLHADGSVPTGPIALAEVQGYVHAAFLARADLAELAGEAGGGAAWRERAAELRGRFDAAFWDDELGFPVLALDGERRPVRVVSSNVGHCLWTGILGRERAERVADVLLSPAMFTGWGLRTLSRDARSYNPISYHNGSVWPHDTALAAEGLSRAGFPDHAGRLIRAQLDVARSLGGRLPELFAGFDRTEVGVPASYPASCSPQAWAAASPFLWLRSLLRLDVRGGGTDLWLDPHLLPGMERLTVDGVRVAGRRLTIAVEHGRVRVDGAEDLQVHLGRPRAG